MSTNEMHEKETLKVENTKAQMRKGVLEMCILGIISGEELYTTDIINKLKEKAKKRIMATTSLKSLPQVKHFLQNYSKAGIN